MFYNDSLKLSLCNYVSMQCCIIEACPLIHRNCCSMVYVTRLLSFTHSLLRKRSRKDNIKFWCQPFVILHVLQNTIPRQTFMKTLPCYKCLWFTFLWNI